MTPRKNRFAVEFGEAAADFDDGDGWDRVGPQVANIHGPQAVDARGRDFGATDFQVIGGFDDVGMTRDAEGLQGHGPAASPAVDLFEGELAHHAVGLIDLIVDVSDGGG
ncbi:MAG: hypothetical protein WDO18_10545 [Acidobacteriota bacterium]